MKGGMFGGWLRAVLRRLRLVVVLISVFVIPSGMAIAGSTAGASLQSSPAIPAFPGAEGFGASATGGRGGRVLYVTNLEADPNGAIPGSFNYALRQPGPRTIVFRVSGVINGAANIVHGDVTIAGQTSPGGITVRGLVCDGHYERNACSNIIVRHIRSRPAHHLGNATYALDDALRLDGLQHFVIDHASFANAQDEAAQLSWASRGTIQNSIFAETVGPHSQYGGMLLNYSVPAHPQDFLSLHHNWFHRLGGRLPEITCEGSDGDYRDCQAHPLHIELSYNLVWDPGYYIWYNRFVDQDESRGPYRLHLNMVGNQWVTRPEYPYGMMVHDVLDESENSLYVAGNRMSRYPTYADYGLFYCCNDFAANAPNTDLGAATRRAQRHDFPTITDTPADRLTAYMIANAGAFPRDAMDRRYVQSLQSGTLDPTPLDRPGANDALTLGFDLEAPPAAPQDSDSDGMPDAFESRYGLDPSAPDQNGTQLSVLFTGVPGYTNLEAYLNWLSDNLVSGKAPPSTGGSSEPRPATTVIDEDFALPFTFVAGGDWSVRDGRLILANPASATPHGNLAMHNTTVPGNKFTAEVQGRVTGSADRWLDFSLIFNYQDPNNYLFASVNTQDDNETNGVFRYANGTLTQLANFPSVITPDATYQVKVERIDSTITVFQNGTLVATTTDSRFSGGQIGVGSRNDAATFDALVVRMME